MTSIGLPYARATVNALGRYAVECPVCGQLFSGPDELVFDEDTITKGASRAYAEHFLDAHPGPVA